jgi:ribokinase
MPTVTTPPALTVVGSANADLVLPVRRLASPGETVLASGRRLSPGGKGLNQAVAAARSGCRTRFVAAIGADAEGSMLRQVLAEENLDVVLRATDASTGLAVVMVDDAGENSIVVVPGANAELRDLTAEELTAVTDSAVLLMQLEIPLATVAAAARRAKAAGTMVVLNAAPATPVVPDLQGFVDVLVVNEGEARALVSSSAGSFADSTEHGLDHVIDSLLSQVPTVVITLGEHGAVMRNRDGFDHTEPGRRVPVVDTTGAGDTFTGYLAAALADNDTMPTAMRRATAAAALCVQRQGAVPAVPRRDEVEALLLD